ncbi:sulfotransferase family protein [Inmirania thermothiophila]|uniref:Sulfotransferase family protein n=1 Tax=Inmirania thermothiophila TaxID=1750597 RepID=A0A3N1XTN2_9GAMM|nr:sulfotransferase [Inmirania thermothiophila]ROR29618.1 sulfotransferase family protein [Inmirania thermothiophila]
MTRRDGAGLILLFGMPRSGTTWVAKILDSHPETLYRHEPDSRHLLQGVPLFPARGEWDGLAPALRRYAAALPRMRDVRTCGKLPIFPKRHLGPGRGVLLRAGVVAAKAAARAGLDLPVPGAAWGADTPGVRLVWKSIESLGRLGALRHALPDAVSVHILRHPCGYAASVARGEAGGRFTGAGTAAEDWGIFEMLLKTDAARRRGLRMEHLRGASPWQRLAWRWVLTNEKALDDLEGAAGHRLLVYERLCEAPAEEARALLAHCGLGWHEQTAAFVAASTGGHDRGYYSVVKDPRRSAWGWREELPAGAVEAILAVTADSPAFRPYAEGGA